MIVPQKLSHLKDQTLLLLVSGKQSIDVYRLADNTLELIHSLEAEVTSYSDNEGHFKVRSQGKVMRSGAVKENRKEELLSKFIAEIKKEMKGIKPSGYDGVYLFCPSRLKNSIVDAFPALLVKRITAVIEGNYHLKDPVVFLSKIPKKKKNSGLLQTLEAKKILDRSKKARKFIKGV